MAYMTAVPVTLLGPLAGSTAAAPVAGERLATWLVRASQMLQYFRLAVR
jgi:hypothetical protein